MIYIICRNVEEIKYNLPKEGFKVIVNTCPNNFYGEFGAWLKIYKDAKENNYENIGVYQARRYFHKNNLILTNKDFNLDNTDIYLVKYPLNKHTIYTQFNQCHPLYKDLLENIGLSNNEIYIAKNTNYIFPHNMFYTKFSIFEKMCEYIFNLAATIKTYKKDDSKILGFLGERLLSIFVLSNKLKYTCVNCIRINKTTLKIDDNDLGIEKWPY